MIAFNLGTLQARRGDHAVAIDLIEEARAIWLDEHGPEDARILSCDIAIAASELHRGNAAESAERLEQIIVGLEPREDPQNRMSRARCLIFLVEARTELGQMDAVDRAIDELLLLALERAVGGRDRTKYHVVAARLIAGYRPADAIEILVAEHDRVVAALGADHEAAATLADDRRQTRLRLGEPSSARSSA